MNKPGTANVGAISKARNCKRGTLWAVKLQLVAKYEKNEGEPFGDLKKFPKKILMRFLNSVTVPKNVKGGALWDFLTSIVLQNIETNEGETLWWNPKKFKNRIFPKNQSEKHQRGPMFSRFWTSMFLFWTRFWRFEYVLDVRSSS